MDIKKISESYLSFLADGQPERETQLQWNKAEKRVYTGVVLEMGRFKYFAPLTSPKEKHKKLSNSIDFKKLRLEKKNGQILELGALNLNLMIPIPHHEIIDIDLRQETSFYADIIKKQYKVLTLLKEAIERDAEKLYDKIVNNNNCPENLKKRCLDFSHFEQKYLEWENKKGKV
ncbi:MAG: type III toxin-antitoxin system ToxN/AbiQ family toxin [Cetobacterium sp.]